MKIIKLEAENVKRLEAVTITPDGNLVVIGGKNGQGKSSTLDAIEYALGGKAGVCDEPIRRGKEKARTVVDLEGLVVTRTFTRNGGSTLTVANKDGAKYDSPQALLDGLYSRLSFDPLAFATMDVHKRLATLKAVVGLDFAELDAKRHGIFDERTAVNREVKALTANLEACETFPDAPDGEVSVAALIKELETRQDVNVDNEAVRTTLRHIERYISDLQADIDQIGKELATKQATLRNTEQRRNDISAKADTLTDANEQDVRDQIASAETVNRQVRANIQHAGIDNQLQRKFALADSLTSQLNAIDKVKADTLAAAEFPVDRLSFDETGVTFEDLPFDQASDAEKLRVSVAMGLAMNPKLRVLLIRNGSLLDKDNLAMIAKMAKDADAQIFMERVGEGKECSVIIKDGKVA